MMKLEKSEYARYIGVDVSKATLDIDDSAARIDRKVPNVAEAIVQLRHRTWNPGEERPDRCRRHSAAELSLVELRLRTAPRPFHSAPIKVTNHGSLTIIEHRGHASKKSRGFGGWPLTAMAPDGAG